MEMAIRKINVAISYRKNPIYFNTRSTLFGLTKQYELALKDLQLASLKDSTNPILYYKQALCFFAKKDERNAYKFLNKAKEMDPFELFMKSEDSLIQVLQPIYTSVSAQLDKCVNNQILIWQKKGEFETQSDYQIRMNDVSQKQQIEQIQSHCLEDLKKSYCAKIDWQKDLKLNVYDPENQTFRIDSKEFGTFVLSVPKEEALGFKKNFNLLTIKPDLYLNTNKKVFEISKIAFASDKNTYTYDSKISNEYVQPKLDYQVKSIAVSKNKYESIITKYPTENSSKFYTNDSLEVDLNIPINDFKNDKTFVVIIANENYSSEVDVQFALNDGRIFKEYCRKTLCIPEQNISIYENATYGTMKKAIKWISDVLIAFKGDGKVIFYYAGHGMPNELDKSAYLLPTDGTSFDYDGAIKVDDMVAKLAALPSKQVAVILDACFSGSIRDEGMLAQARGVKIKPKVFDVKGNIVMFSASQAEESAFSYYERKHGLFTYYLLRKIQKTKGDFNFEQLASYLQSNVNQQSLLINKKSQTPQVIFPDYMKNTWQKLGFK
jgi:tetratricopeptide (TPR) repeat protein